MEIRRARFQRTTSAFGDLRPGLSAYAIEQIIELNKVFGVCGILPMFSLFNVLHQDVRKGASLKSFYHYAHLLEVVKLHATAFAVTWLGRLFALGQLYGIRALAFSQQFSFRDRRRWAHSAFVIHFVYSLPCVIE